MKNPHEMEKLIPPKSGIYFLFSGDELIYIGRTKNLYSRLGSHRFIKFDSFAFLPYSGDDIGKLERRYIIKYKPKLNGNVGETSEIIDNLEQDNENLRAQLAEALK